MEQFVAVGRRKAAIARVFLSPGSGSIIINDRTFEEFMPINYLRESVMQSLRTVEGEGKYDVKVNVNGGGIKGQAEAIRLGIARALVAMDSELKPALRSKGLMTRDPREVERKKSGLRKARKREQYSKR
ncbi:MAG: 30S ribosomal protein S9 [Sphingobacteriales bacterium]|jgi:small subunit ribosomal protein S9|nr:30S ribosomal protein S9 [Sphingobacteriales bacterium]MBP9141275.1 30S ribosomal protein S9 [Chitinophagales bacterium]MDA0197939.1 30S ribosomal protein S9 [Bacteroidota bacterium]MBK6890831.1 30S ribosomal protein S9 [Sphingobacteriales bacterium]MBK7526116.1 30S ribosomal protein S9 [Sphingobacteriales bacterium]